jgi:hypothetical protein
MGVPAGGKGGRGQREGFWEEEEEEEEEEKGEEEEEEEKGDGERGQGDTS